MKTPQKASRSGFHLRSGVRIAQEKAASVVRDLSALLELPLEQRDHSLLVAPVRPDSDIVCGACVQHLSACNASA
jgi:hypothetical protein